jgi:hypothetical protein
MGAQGRAWRAEAAAVQAETPSPALPPHRTDGCSGIPAVNQIASVSRMRRAGFAACSPFDGEPPNGGNGKPVLEKTPPVRAGR